MRATPPTDPPPSFSPELLTDLYRTRRHVELSESLLAVLRHFRDTVYTRLEPQGAFFINAFVKHFLALFAGDAYTPGRDHLFAFVRLNHTISNLVAVSAFGTTDAVLEALRNRPGGLGKVMALYSARNRLTFDPKVFFDADPALASAWYGAYAEGYRSALIREDVSERLAKHFAFEDDRLDAGESALDAYFASSYLDGGVDRILKPAINRAVRRRLAAEGVVVRPADRADPRKVAVFSGNWAPAHSVYRINEAYVRALKDDGYHLTFFPLNRRPDADPGLFDVVTPLATGPNGMVDVGPLQGNEFALAYFPDVGLTPQSIVLANLRVAPVQVASHGHAASTWGALIDDVISGEEVEVRDDPGRNYSERLVLIPGCGAIHNRPTDPPPLARPRRDADAPFVLNCPWTAPKVNRRLALLLREAVGRARRKLLVRLFVSTSLSRHGDYLPFVRDLEDVLGADAFEVVGPCPNREYLTRMAEGDVGLDAHPYGGCNSVLDSLVLRKPTVAYEGGLWGNRIAAAMLRRVGLPDLVATSDDEYLALILRLADDDSFHASVRDRLDRADLDATVFDRSDARDFAGAVTYLIANHDRLTREADRSPIRVARDRGDASSTGV